VIASFSIKDRGAIFGGGRRPTTTLWFDRSLDRFVTSTAFATSFPTWADALAVPTAVRAAPWTLTDPAWVRAHAATPDDAPGEGDLGGLGTTFPHDVAHAENPARAFTATPFADQALFDLALAALDAHRTEPGTRLVALSLSANDYIGHTFGPDSWEAWDELLELDARLGKFFAALDARFGTSGWAALLTADHGVTTMPEAADAGARKWCTGDAGAGDPFGRACGKVARVFPAALGAELAAVAEATLHQPGLVSGVLDPYVYFSERGRALSSADRARLVAALTRALEKHDTVERVIDTRLLGASDAGAADACPPAADASGADGGAAGVPALVCRSFVPGHAGDLYIVLRPGNFFDPDVVVGKGTSHGSPWLFDRTVPLFARAPGRIAAGRVLDEPIAFTTFTRTLESLLGLPPRASGDAASWKSLTTP
jgi:hypothetical protein